MAEISLLDVRDDDTVYIAYATVLVGSVPKEAPVRFDDKKVEETTREISCWSAESQLAEERELDAERISLLRSETNRKTQAEKYRDRDEASKARITEDNGLEDRLESES